MAHHHMRRLSIFIGDLGGLIAEITWKAICLFLVVLCFQFPENSRFVQSDEKQEIFCGIINEDFCFSESGILPK